MGTNGHTFLCEDYVSFEIAKLLKEKGFNWCDSPFYSEQDKDEWRQNNSYTIPNEDYDPDLPFDSETLTLVSPHVSIQMAMKWLREEKDVQIEISIVGTDTWESPTKWMYGFRCQTKDVIDRRNADFSSYEEACEAAIKYCLENLI